MIPKQGTIIHRFPISTTQIPPLDGIINTQTGTDISRKLSFYVEPSEKSKPAPSILCHYKTGVQATRPRRSI